MLTKINTIIFAGSLFFAGNFANALGTSNQNNMFFVAPKFLSKSYSYSNNSSAFDEPAEIKELDKPDPVAITSAILGGLALGGLITALILTKDNGEQPPTPSEGILIQSSSNYNLLSVVGGSSAKADVANGVINIKNISDQPINGLTFILNQNNVINLDPGNCSQTIPGGATCSANISYQSTDVSGNIQRTPVIVTVKSPEDSDQIVINAISMPVNKFFKPAVDRTDAHSLVDNNLRALIAIHKGNAEILYAGTRYSGIYKSTDQGETWIAVNNGLTILEIYSLLAGKNGDLYAGTNERGLFKSTNNGITWHAVNNTEMEDSDVDSLFESDDGSFILAGTNRGLFKSEDHGGSWALVNINIPALPLPNAAQPPILDIYSFVEANNDNLYAGTDMGLFESIDKGNNWNHVNLATDTIPSVSLNIKSLLKTNNGDLYAATDSEGVYKSSDQGDSWTNIGLKEHQIYSLVELDDGSILAAAERIDQTSMGIYKYINNTTWNLVDNPLAGLKILLLKKIGNILYAVTEDNNVFKSANLGTSWQELNSGLAELPVSAFLETNGGTLYVGTFGGVYKSTDEGANWLPASNGLKVRNVNALIAAQDGDFYAGVFQYPQGGIYKSADLGANWEEKSNGLTQFNVSSLLETADGTALFAGVIGTVDQGETIFKSTDHGENWIAKMTGLPPYLPGQKTPKVYSLLEYIGTTAANSTILFLGTNVGIFKSMDQGESWGDQQLDTQINTFLETSDGKLFAGTGNQVYPDGIWRSDDAGTTWESKNNGLTYLYIRKLLESNDSSTLYAAEDGENPLFASIDQGENWSKIDGSPEYIQSLYETKDSSALYVGAYGLFTEILGP